MKIKKILSVCLSLSLVFSTLSGCGSTSKNNVDTQHSEINIAIIDQDKDELEDNRTLSNEATENNLDITGIVSSMISSELEDRGYMVSKSVAFNNDETYEAFGIGYFNPEINLFANEEYASLGFINVIGPDDEYIAVPTDCEYVAVEPVDDNLATGASYNLLAYSCDDLSTGHLVYKDKYIIYYQLDDNTVKYETFDNVEENYDYSIGSLFDFDNDIYIYNEALFEEYEPHSGEELFSEKDYLALETELQKLSEQQEKNGYYVEEINIVYISPESIEAYLESKEEDTFFGYSVAQLESSLGLGKALVYTENGIETAEYFEDSSEDYNWKSFLVKVGIGCGIILVGAVLTPITGGASFGCALITISKVAVTMALAQGLGTLAIETATSMIEGKDFETAIKYASFKGLDSFANGFMIGAAVGNVGTVTGLIKPVACFTAGTMIAVPGSFNSIQYVPIENVAKGDCVFAYNEQLEEIGVYRVSDTFVHNVNELVRISIDGEIIETTYEHPFYSADCNGWIKAGELKLGNRIKTMKGTFVVNNAECVEVESIPVYNFMVEDAHTYFVGRIGALVHNQCNTIKNARKNGVRKAWAKEVQAVKDGNSKYNWSKKELEEILERGKIEGYDGCHIVDVQVDPSLAANPDNIILLKHEVHINIVHGGNTSNLSHWGEIIKIMPQFEQQVLAIGGLL